MKYDVSLQTVSWIVGRRNQNELEISPNFQRRPVWLEKERSALMETICARLPFPEIYTHVVTDTTTLKEKHIVVDGQQRVTSVLMFVDGEVQLPEFYPWNGRYFKDLEQTEKQDFLSYKIVVRNLYDTNDAEIRDLFVRLNTNNFALNDQELRNARYQGKFKQASERLADNPLFQQLNLFTAREVRRMEDIEFVSELLVRVVEGVTNKKDMLENAYAHFDEEFPQEALYESEFNAAINLITALVTEENKALVKTKSNFYSIFGACLCYHRNQKRTSFKNSDSAAKEITDLLSAVKTIDPATAVAGAPVFDYYNAVSRAASDKSRRAERERILGDILRTY